MTATGLNDPEVVDLLREDAALLAIADAVAVTQSSPSLAWPYRSPGAQPHAHEQSSVPTSSGGPGAGRSWFGLPRLRSTFTLAAAAVAVVLVPTAIAFRSSLLHVIDSEPAPPRVAEAFSAWNKALVQLHDFHQSRTNETLPPAPRAATGASHGVVRLDTADGSVTVWAAPEDGGGQCFQLQTNVAVADGGDGFRSVGTCDSTLRIHSPYSNPDAVVPWPVSFAQHGQVVFVLVRVYSAAKVMLKLADGSEPELQIVDGFALAAVPAQEQPVRVLATDPSGTIIADDPVEGHIILAS